MIWLSLELSTWRHDKFMQLWAYRFLICLAWTLWNLRIPLRATGRR